MIHDDGSNRPPRGVEPRHLWEEERIEALRQAINRFLDAGWWPHVEWIREMADLVEGLHGPTRGPSFAAMHNEERRPDMHDVFGQQEIDCAQAIRGEPPIKRGYERRAEDSEINGLPSTSQPRPSPPLDVPDGPTAESISPLDAAIAVLEAIIRDKRLPGGQDVKEVRILNPDYHPNDWKVVLRHQGQEFLLTRRHDGSIEVQEAFCLDGPWTQTNRCREMAEILNETVASLRARGVPRPSGLSEGLQQPQTPMSQADAGWEEWVDLKTRVEHSEFRPYWDPDSGWCVVSPATGNSQVFGRTDADRSAAYRWVAQLLSLRPLVAERPR